MAEGTRTSTNTQIRNFYSDGYSYLNMRFYNTNLSFSFSPFQNKDANGRPNYDLTKSVSTTVNFEGAFALFNMANQLIAHPSMTGGIDIPCNGATLRLERRNTNPSEVLFTITKNGTSIPFKFDSYPMSLNENGQTINRQMECGLGAFAKTVEGYLVGINADRHLDKLTEDYAKLKGGQTTNNQGGAQRGNFPQNNYQRNNWNGGNNNYRKNNNGGNFQRRNNNWNNNQNRNNNQQSWETKTNTQNISTYQLQD